MKVVLIGHRYVDQPRGGGFAWGLAQTGVKLEVVKVGCGAIAQPIPELRRVRVSALDLPTEVLVSVTEKKHKPGWYIVKTRQRDGHTTTEQTQRPPTPAAQHVRESLARTIKGDHGILLKGMQLHPADVAWLAERVDLTYMLVDVASSYTLERGRHCARVIVTGPEAERAFAALDVPVRTIIQGWRPHVWAPPLGHWFGRTVLPQIAFTGSERRDRIESIRALTEAGLRLAHRDAWLGDAAALYRTSAVTLCPHNSPDGRDSFSNRLVRVLAAGGVPLHAWTPSLSATFPDVPTYRNGAELVRAARALLAQDPVERAALVMRLRAAAQPYTWDKVAQRWLDFIAQTDGAAACSS